MSPAAGESRTSVRVTIAGEQYTLRTDADEAYTRRCAALVDERMRAIGGQSGWVPRRPPSWRHFPCQTISCSRRGSPGTGCGGL